MARTNKSAYERTRFIAMTDDIDAFDLADMLMLRQPLIINFEDYHAVKSNQVITFLSGIVYAIDGNVEVIREKVLVFATKEDLKDKSLRKFIKKHKE